MNREAHDAEQLNAALDAVAAGASPEQALAGLPPELQRLAETGDWFLRAGAEAGPRPRPSFMLGLEDQLRTDLRLRPAAPVDGDAPGSARGLPASLFAFLRRPRVLGLLLLGLVGLFGLTQRALPGDPLYGAKRLVERTVEALAPSQSMRANICLDRGWRRLEETEALLVGGSDADLLERVLTDLVDDYRSALEHAAASDDERVNFRAATEVAATRDRIDRLAATASPEDSSLLVEAREALEEARMRLGISHERPKGPGSEPIAPTEAAEGPVPPVAGTASAPAEPSPTLVSGGPEGTEAATASPSPSASATASPTPKPAATATALIPAASATPTASRTPTQTSVPPPTDRPKPKRTRVPPTETPVPQATPEPSRTPDAWAATATPVDPTETPGANPGIGDPGGKG